ALGPALDPVAQLVGQTTAPPVDRDADLPAAVGGLDEVPAVAAESPGERERVPAARRLDLHDRSHRSSTSKSRSSSRAANGCHAAGSHASFLHIGQLAGTFGAATP